MKKYLLLTVTGFIFCSFAFAQNVGIGTNNPKNKLHVAGGLRAARENSLSRIYVVIIFVKPAWMGKHWVKVLVTG